MLAGLLDVRDGHSGNGGAFQFDLQEKPTRDSRKKDVLKDVWGEGGLEAD